MPNVVIYLCLLAGLWSSAHFSCCSALNYELKIVKKSQHIFHLYVFFFFYSLCSFIVCTWNVHYILSLQLQCDKILKTWSCLSNEYEKEMWQRNARLPFNALSNTAPFFLVPIFWNYGTYRNRKLNKNRINSFFFFSPDETKVKRFFLVNLRIHDYCFVHVRMDVFPSIIHAWTSSTNWNTWIVPSYRNV